MRWPDAARRWALGAAALAVLALGQACAGPSERKVTALLLGSEILARVSHVVEVETVRGRGWGDPERPYRRAAVLFDSRVTCASDRPPGASCGASVEVYRTDERAAARLLRLQAEEPHVVRRSAYVLRVSPDLGGAAARQYRDAFLEAVDSDA